MSWPTIPPEYRDRRWPYRVTARNEDGQQVERVVQSRFPPMQVGVPGEPTQEFVDFQRYAGLVEQHEHPEWFCAVHYRRLGKRELEWRSSNGVEIPSCFWCYPERGPKPKERATAKGITSVAEDGRPLRLVEPDVELPFSAEPDQDADATLW